MDTYVRGDGSFSEIHPPENGSSFVAFNIPLNAPWKLQCSKDSSALLPRSVEEGTIANVYGGNGFLANDSVFRLSTSSPDHWNHPHPATVDTAISPAPKSQLPTATSLKEPGRLSRPSTAENKNRKRKCHATGGATRKSIRRPSSKNDKINTIIGESGGDLRCRYGTCSQRGSEPSDVRCDGGSLTIKARNRIAANNYRNKKKGDILRLESKEQALEQINRTLSVRAASLTREVYELKRKLLQHSDCGCTLIQAYIINEARKYVQGLENRIVKEVTVGQGVIAQAPP